MVAKSDMITETISSPFDDNYLRVASPSQYPMTEARKESTASDLSSVGNSASSAIAVSRTDLMNQSTIYRRHEARLVRSYALRDDPRPAFIRVLSGLPGFRIIIPPYQKATTKETGKPNQQKSKQRQEMNAPNTVKGVYSEETLFAPYSDIADNAVGSSFTRRNGNSNTNDDINYAVAFKDMTQAMLATGFCSGIAEYMFAYHNNVGTAKRTVRNSNAIGPMTIVAATTSTAAHQSSLLFQQDVSATSNIGGFAVYKGSPRQIPNATNNKTLPSTAAKTRPSTVALSKAMSTSFSVSLLFGTKVFLDSTMRNQQLENEVKHSNSLAATASLLSSTIAGGMVGLSQLTFLQIQHRRLWTQPSSLPIDQQQYFTNNYSSKLIGRNALAAILYFSIYEGVSSFSSWKAAVRSQSDPNIHSLPTNSLSAAKVSGEKGTLSIAIGGALAGVAHVGAMNYHRYADYGSTIWWSRVMLPAASRMVPIHALVFYGYEKMKEGVMTAQ